MELDQKFKILVVAESLDPEDSSGTKGRVALIKNLAKQNFDIRVYHYTRKEIKIDEIRCIAIKENRKSFLFLLSRVERQLRRKLGVELNDYIERLFGFSFTLFNDRNSIVKELKKIDSFRPDLVLTLSKGGSFRPHHALLKLPQFHENWMAYIHDPYPMHSYPRPYDWVEPGHQKKRRFFEKVSEKCAYAAYPSLLLADWMESYFPSLKGKTIIIPHQIEEEVSVLEDLPPYFKKDHFTIVHAGTLMSARKPIALVKAFCRFLKEIPEAGSMSQMIFLGEKSVYSEFFEEIRKEVPQFYYSNAYVAFEEVKKIQNKAAVNVILEAKGPVSPFLPGKFPHCIKARKPILLLGPYYSESRRLLGKDYPFWSEIDDEDTIFQHLLSLFHKWRSGDFSEFSEKYEELNLYLSGRNLKEIIGSLYGKR